MGLVMRVTPGDLYRLRRFNLYAEKKALEAQRARNLVQEAVLRLEVKYHLLGADASLDSHSGVITRLEAVGNGPLGNEDASPQGPA
ncbi:MAG: hypothetical protein HYX92_20480 [Chloroflexi bacterium]|nr:hypothetical protein [Chloroflexota bacterium]